MSEKSLPVINHCDLQLRIARVIERLLRQWLHVIQQINILRALVTYPSERTVEIMPHGKTKPNCFCHVFLYR
jgi:hypothetical protein